jgi:hypothetical protein
MELKKEYKLTPILIRDISRLVGNGNVLYVKYIGNRRFILTDKYSKGFIKVKYATNEYIRNLLLMLMYEN